MRNVAKYINIRDKKWHKVKNGIAATRRIASTTHWPSGHAPSTRLPDVLQIDIKWKAITQFGKFSSISCRLSIK